MRKAMLAVSIVFLSSFTAAATYEPRHPLSQIQPIDVPLNMSSKAIFNTTEIELKDGLTITDEQFITDSGVIVLEYTDETGASDWKFRDDINITSDSGGNPYEIKNFFQERCYAGTVVDKVYPNGSYICQSITETAEGTFVDESGDNMTGDLNLSGNDLENPGNITGFFASECGTGKLVSQVYPNGTYECQDTDRNGEFAQDLEEVLAVGNDAGDYNINMSGNNISQVNKLNANGKSLDIGGILDIANPSNTGNTVDIGGDVNLDGELKTNGNRVFSGLGNSQTIRGANGVDIKTSGGGINLSEDSQTGLYIDINRNVEVPNGNLDLQGNTLIDTTGSNSVNLGDGTDDNLNLDAGGSGSFSVRTGNGVSGSTQRILATSGSGTTEVNIQNSNLDLNDNNLTDFFKSNCGAGEVITSVNEDGAYNCADIDQNSDFAQDLEEVLDVGNNAVDDNISLDDNDLLEPDEIRTSGSGSDTIAIRDSANSQDILIAYEGGNIGIPSGRLDLSSPSNTGSTLNVGGDANIEGNVNVSQNNITSVSYVKFQDGTTIGGGEIDALDSIEGSGDLLRITSDMSMDENRIVNIGTSRVNFTSEGDINFNDRHINELASIDGGGNSIEVDDSLSLNDNNLEDVTTINSGSQALSVGGNTDISSPTNFGGVLDIGGAANFDGQVSAYGTINANAQSAINFDETGSLYQRNNNGLEYQTDGSGSDFFSVRDSTRSKSVFKASEGGAVSVSSAPFRVGSPANTDHLIDVGGPAGVEGRIDMNENQIQNIDEIRDNNDTTTINFDGSNNVALPSGNLDLQGNTLVDTTGSNSVNIGDGTNDNLNLEAGGSGTFSLSTGNGASGSTQRLTVNSGSGTPDFDVENSNLDLNQNRIKSASSITTVQSGTGIEKRYDYGYDQGNDGTTYYHYLGEADSNQGVFHVSGTVGGHTPSQGKAYIEMIVNSRSKDIITSKVQGNLGSSADFVVYEDGNGNLEVYMETDQWAQTQLTYGDTGGAGNTNSEPTPTTTAPSGTLEYRLSQDKEFQIDLDGNTNLNDQNLTNFFKDTCGTGEVVTKVNEDGSYECEDVDQNGDFAQSLAEVLDIGNQAVDDNISLSQQDINNVDQIRIPDNGDSSGKRLIEIGDDSFLTDIDSGNTLGVFGRQNQDSGRIRLGQAGGRIDGDSSGNLVLETTNSGSAFVQRLQATAGSDQGEVDIQNAKLDLNQNNISSVSYLKFEDGTTIGGGSIDALDSIDGSGDLLRITSDVSMVQNRITNIGTGEVNFSAQGDLDFNDRNINELSSVDGGGDSIEVDDSLSLNDNNLDDISSINSGGQDLSIGSPSNEDHRVDFAGPVGIEGRIDMNENQIQNLDEIRDNNDTTTVNFDGSNNVEVPNGNVDLRGNSLVDDSGSNSVSVGDGSDDNVNVEAGGGGSFSVSTGDGSSGSTTRLVATSGSGESDVDVSNADIDLQGNSVTSSGGEVCIGDNCE